MCRPGGSIGLISWTPEGLIGSMFGVIAPYAPPPPPGAKPGSSVGHGGATSAGCSATGARDVRSERREVLFEGLTPDSFVDLMSVSYGSALGVYEKLADDPERAAKLDEALRTFRARLTTAVSGSTAARGRVPAHDRPAQLTARSVWLLNRGQAPD